MPFQPTIIIPTKDRREILSHLLDSIQQLTAIDRIVPEIIVADNNSRDDTYEYLTGSPRPFQRQSVFCGCSGAENRQRLTTPCSYRRVTSWHF